MPVAHAIRSLIFGMSIGPFMGLGHALHRSLSELIMSDHDERYNGCQALRRDSCTNAPQERTVSACDETLLGELSQRSVVQVLFGAGSGGGILAITAFNSILAVFATLWLQSHCPPCVCYAIMRTTSPKP